MMCKTQRYKNIIKGEEKDASNSIFLLFPQDLENSEDLKISMNDFWNFRVLEDSYRISEYFLI